MSRQPRRHQQIRSYIELSRLHKFPLGILPVFWPCAWGLTLATVGTDITISHLLKRIALAALGSTLIHSAACIWSDICDVEFDRQVERTKSRPLASGRVSEREAYLMLTVTIATFMSMYTLLNSHAFILGIVWLFPLNFLYPFMKRWTSWPQLWLGITINWGWWMAWASVDEIRHRSDIFVFFFGMICWTIVYDTIYACQDRKDDYHAGVKSTALLFGTAVRPILICIAGSFVTCMAYAGTTIGMGLVFLAVSCIGSVAHFMWQFMTWNPDNRSDCGDKFKANGYLGFLIWGGMLFDQYWYR